MDGCFAYMGGFLCGATSVCCVSDEEGDKGLDRLIEYGWQATEVKRVKGSSVICV